MDTHRIRALAVAADVVAVVVFAAIGRASHAEPGDVVGLLVTAAPFVVGTAAAWASPLVRARPAGPRAGAVVVAATSVLGLLLRAAVIGRLPWPFALVTVVSLAVLMLGWRCLAAFVAHQAGLRVG